MDQATHNKIVSFIWGIADDVLRDLFKRGKYPDDIHRICETYLAFEETEQSKIFPNKHFGYWKVKVERPLRLHSRLSRRAIESLRFTSGDEDLRRELYDRFGENLYEDFEHIKPEVENMLNEWSAGDDEPEIENEGEKKKGLPMMTKKKLLDAKTWERDGRLVETANALYQELGDALFEDHNGFRDAVADALKKGELKVSAADLKIIFRAVSWRVETAPPVIAKTHKSGNVEPDPLHGRYESTLKGKTCVVEYEPDPDLRDSEQIPLLEDGGIEAFFRREALPYTPDAWIDESATRIGYEISFTRHFYKPQPLRALEEIRADIIAVQQETEGLLDGIITGGKR